MLRMRDRAGASILGGRRTLGDHRRGARLRCQRSPPAPWRRRRTSSRPRSSPEAVGDVPVWRSSPPTSTATATRTSRSANAELGRRDDPAQRRRRQLRRAGVEPRGRRATLPLAVAAADLDGDTDQDLAVANYSSDDVTILHNNGRGSFIEAGHEPRGRRGRPDARSPPPTSTATRDSDLAVVQQQLRRRARSSATTASATSPSPPRARSRWAPARVAIAAADLDGDARPGSRGRERRRRQRDRSCATTAPATSASRPRVPRRSATTRARSSPPTSTATPTSDLGDPRTAAPSNVTILRNNGAGEIRRAGRRARSAAGVAPTGARRRRLRPRRRSGSRHREPLDDDADDPAQQRRRQLHRAGLEPRGRRRRPRRPRRGRRPRRRRRSGPRGLRTSDRQRHHPPQPLGGGADLGLPRFARPREIA